MTFEEKYPATGLDGENASWAGPGFRRLFVPVSGTPMKSGVAYTVGKLPRGFDPVKAAVTVKTAATAGTLGIVVKKTSDATTVWTVAATANLAAVAATAFASNLPGLLTEECDLIVTPSTDIEDGEFAIEIAGNVFGVPVVSASEEE